VALYGIAQQSITQAIATPAWEIRAASTNKPRLFELGFSQIVAPSAVCTYGLGRPSSVGVNPTSTTSFIADSDASAAASLTSVATAWGTAPGVPANFNRRINCNTLAGVGAIWAFPRGLDIGAGSSLVLWLITATTTLLNMWALIDE